MSNVQEDPGERFFFSLNDILKKKKKVLNIFNWSIIALQHCVGLCHPPA